MARAVTQEEMVKFCMTGPKDLKPRKDRNSSNWAKSPGWCWHRCI